jgi:hypothetical protein
MIKHYCIDCKKETKGFGIRCPQCFSKGVKNGNYKHGKYIVVYHNCIICGKKVSCNCKSGHCTECKNKLKRQNRKRYCEDCGKEISKKSPQRKTNKCLSCFNNSNIGKKRPEHSKRMLGRDNPMFNVHLKVKQSTKKKISKAMKGNKNPMYGKTCPHSKYGQYNNIWMRSGYEIAYAKYLDKQGIKWQYEPKRFYFCNLSYLPDFYLPESDTYVEIKGWWRKQFQKRFKLFKKYNPKIKIIVLMQKELKKLGVLS